MTAAATQQAEHTAKTFAVIGRSVSRYSNTLKEVERWEIREIGRETPTRLYRHAVKPARYGADEHWDKASAIARFTTKDEADAFLARLKSDLYDLLAAELAAKETVRAAREALGVASRALRDAVSAWVAAQPEAA